MFQQLIRDRKGAALLEYSLLAAGVALISAAGVALYGHQTNDIISAVAAIMPGAHADDNGPIVSGKIIETTGADTGQIQIDVNRIVTEGTDTPRLGNNLGVQGLDSLVLEVGE
jgi:Flp pilus assembly pilin Flp